MKPKRAKAGTPTLDRLLARVKKSPSGCWLYLGCIKARGYGSIGINGNTMHASRAMLIETTGINPPDKQACHTCDTPACINPTHLWWGTHAENMADMAKKGRAKGSFGHSPLFGESNHAAKLTVDDVAMIRAKYSSGKYTQKQLAEMFGVRHGTISKIIHRQRWAHVA